MNRRRAHHQPRQTVVKVSEPGTNLIGTQLIWMILLASAVAIPIYYSPAGIDAFRLPKEILLRAEAMLIAAIALCCRWRLPVPPTRRERQVISFVILVVLWTVVITVTSTYRLLSVMSLVRVTGLAIIFSATYLMARSRSLLTILAAVAPACIIAVDYIIASHSRGTLFRIATGLAERPPAFLGNVDDIGAFLVAPALACVVCTTLKGAARVPAAVAAVLLCFGLLATQTLTPLVSLGAGIAVFVLVRWRRRALANSGALILAMLVTIAIYHPLYTRIRVAVAALRVGNLDQVLSGRLLPFNAAWRMFMDHPILGVGAGCFGWQYFPYKLAVAREHPALLHSSSYNQNFAEAHNDHLQTLAVGGVPAYLLLIGALTWVALASFERERNPNFSSLTFDFARNFSLPFVASFVVMAMAGFPLEVGAVTASHLFLAGLVIRWVE